MTTLPELDAMVNDRGAELLRSCCGATRWVEGMLIRRPFGTLAPMLAAAEAIWWSLDEADWREAFAHHPPIGEERSAEPQDDRARAWSSGEQAGMDGAAAELRSRLAQANTEYERRFGYICIICATGRSAEEMLAITRARLLNAPDAELRIAAEEQGKITRLRLEKLFDHSSGAETG
jgi:2-oxo-4-hydroxy-4-carboxy-5-ureidoimidazoline decarboxylase